MKTFKKRISNEEKKVAKDLARLKREYKKAIKKPFFDEEDKELLKMVFISIGLVLYVINIVALFATEDWRLAVQELDVIIPILLSGLSMLSIVIFKVVIN